MIRRTIQAVLLLLLPSWVLADVTKEDIRKLVENKIGDEVILAFLRANAPVRTLSSDDLIELKKLGASDKVLEAMLPKIPAKTASTEPAKPEVKPQPAPVRETVYVQSPVRSYVYSVPSYSGYWDDPWYGHYGWHYGGHHTGNHWGWHTGHSHDHYWGHRPVRSGCGW